MGEYITFMILGPQVATYFWSLDEYYPLRYVNSYNKPYLGNNNFKPVLNTHFNK